MFETFSQLLNDPSAVSILRVIKDLPQRSTLEKISTLTNLSIIEVKTLLAELQNLEIIKFTDSLTYILTINPSEQNLLSLAINQFISEQIRSNAKLLSEKTPQLFDWIDETVTVWQQVRRQLRDSTKTT